MDANELINEIRKEIRFIAAAELDLIMLRGKAENTTFQPQTHQEKINGELLMVAEPSYGGGMPSDKVGSLGAELVDKDKEIESTRKRLNKQLKILDKVAIIDYEAYYILLKNKIGDPHNLFLRKSIKELSVERHLSPQTVKRKRAKAMKILDEVLHEL